MSSHLAKFKRQRLEWLKPRRQLKRRGINKHTHGCLRPRTSRIRLHNSETVQVAVNFQITPQQFGAFIMLLLILGIIVVFAFKKDVPESVVRWLIDAAIRIVLPLLSSGKEC